VRRVGFFRGINVGGHNKVPKLHVRYRAGQARSKFTIDWIDRQLGTVATGRNLATVEKVLALLDS
jgi:uncharacterized protein (DUF1697 family)